MEERDEGREWGGEGDSGDTDSTKLMNAHIVGRGKNSLF